MVPVTVARALGLPDQPGRSTMDTLLRFVGDRQMLLVLDNCEHLLDASAALVVGSARRLPRADGAGDEPRADRGGRRGDAGGCRRCRWPTKRSSCSPTAPAGPGPTSASPTTTPPRVTEICRRLDGMPLAIELAAARVRALSLTEILDSLHDRFRLLTGGARTAVRRQQTLRASVDWSHALLTEPERVLFRRLAVFLGGFDLDAAQAVAGDGEVERYQVLDQLTLLVDKSLVVAENSQWPNAIPAAGDGAPVRAGEARRVRRGRRRARPSPRPLHGDGRPARRAGRPPAMSGVSSRPRPRSTTCGPRSRGAAKTPTSSWRCSWRRRCSRCGCHGAASGKGWPGSTPPSPTECTPGRGGARGARAGARRQGRRSTSVIGVPPTAWSRPSKPWRSRAKSTTRPCWLRALTACGGIAVFRRRGGPAVLRRGDRPGPRDRRQVEAEPDPRLAGVRGGRRG